jgi:hypothetical protein
LAYRAVVLQWRLSFTFCFTEYYLRNSSVAPRHTSSKAEFALQRRNLGWSSQFMMQNPLAFSAMSTSGQNALAGILGGCLSLTGFAAFGVFDSSGHSRGLRARLPQGRLQSTKARGE